MKSSKFALFSFILAISFGLLSSCVPKGEDPKDYYGVYYGIENQYEIKKLTITSYNVNVFETNGVVTQNNSYPFDYVSAAYAQSTIDAPQYASYDALFLYINEERTQVVALWVVDNTPGNYTLLINRLNIELTKTVITFSDIFSDPQNYYGTYVYNFNNSIKFNSNKIAERLFNGSLSTWDYMYVNSDFINRNIELPYNLTYSRALILFQAGNTEIHVYEIKSSSALLYGGTYTFTKST